MKAEDRVKLYNKIFKYVFWVLLITFLTLYFSQATGYYEYEQHKKVVYTAEQIKKFEKDVEAGKDVRIEDYMETSVKDYSNKTSDLGLAFSENVGKIVKSGIENFFNAINEMVEG